MYYLTDCYTHYIHCFVRVQLLRRVPKVHSFSVTSLCFVSGSEGKQPKELLLSVSADRTCCVTMSKEKGKHLYCFPKLLNTGRYAIILNKNCFHSALV